MAVIQALQKWGEIHHWKSTLQSFQVTFSEEREPLGSP